VPSHPVILIVSSIFFAIASAHAQAPPRIATFELTKKSFDESLDPDMPVSGEVRKGLFAVLPDATVDLNRLGLWVGSVPDKADPNEVLCVFIESRDGRYAAEMRFDMPRTPGLARLAISSRYDDQIRHYTPSKVAVLAYSSTSCPGPFESLYPAIWGVPDTDGDARLDPPSTYTLLLNSQGATVALYDVSTKSGEEQHCERFEEAALRVFDYRCTIVRTEPDQTNGAQDSEWSPDRELVIFRRRFNDRLPPVALRFRQP
jgi:hypothetical protein